MNNIPEGYKLVPIELLKWLENYINDGLPLINSERIMLSGLREALAASAPPKPVHSALNFVCTALPGPGNECVFVELENDSGESLGYGEWLNRDDGLVELHIAVPQPIYDEAKEQEEFEAINPMPDQVTKFKGGYAPTGYSAWDAQDFCKKLDGWKQCAQSRAKAGEDE